ncbi:hypothetical protein CC78DRAFT_123705 [Lojkania enalia]|uniref:Cell wall anchored protein n=1 Tax=Lojkania enalia TaxID=147567 RepID=A0A9P4KEK0_9PLEO|nr:hypothetical protein CC78DRAFT_123705 [Didymosphaeria enalia]
MAFLRLYLLAVLNLASGLIQDSKNPLNDFCRRWGHQTAQVDGKLYIDGGLVAWNPLSTNPLNYTNTWLLYSDLNSSTQDTGMPYQYANLTKNSTVPSVSGGILWADEINKCFYLYGGEFQDRPTEFSFWTYDAILNQWNETDYTTNVDSIQRASYGAGTQIPELGFGFYYGGWLNNQTSPSWSGPPVATNNLIMYDFSAGTLNNNTGPDNVGRAEGSMVYLPASDGGLLAYFGGIEDQHGNGSSVGANMSTIHIFDISSSKWYTQGAQGDVPAARRQFCAGATWADDYSSYNIYLYGGFGVDNATGFDDAYILSMPSFTWIRAWPIGDTAAEFPHGGCSANVIQRDQMLIIGGWFTTSDQCDSPNSWGQHNMNLGYNGAARSLWDKYNPEISAYFVPSPVISVVGGGPTGGATATEPSKWDNPDLAVYFTRVPTFSTRAATRTIPTPTSSLTNPKDSDKNVGAIAGGIVGGLVSLIAIPCLILFCLHHRKKAIKEEEKISSTTPPVELPTTASVHEIASPGNSHIHIRSWSSNNSTSPFPPDPYQSTTSANGSYSPYNTGYPNPAPYQPQSAYPSYTEGSLAYGYQFMSHNPNLYPLPAQSHQHEFSYPSPTSHFDGTSLPYPQTNLNSIHTCPLYPDRTSTPEAPKLENYPLSAHPTPTQYYSQPAISSNTRHSSDNCRSLNRKGRSVRGRFVDANSE